MNIILVNQNYPPHSGYGGIAVYLENFAEQLIQMGHCVKVVAGRYSLSIPEVETVGGIEVHRIFVKEANLLKRLPFIGPHMRGILKLNYSRLVCKKIMEISRKQKPDIVEFAEVEAEGFVYLNQKSRVTTVVRCHTPTFILSKYYGSEMINNPKIVSFLERRSIALADGLTAPSRDMAKQISQECKIQENQIRVIPNPVKDMDLDRSLFRKTEKGVRVLHVGRFDRLKGVEVLAEAICLVVKRNPDIQFIFVGNDCLDGRGSTWQKRLKKYFMDSNVLANVTIVGFLDEKGLKSLYAQSDIAVVPSILYESFSYTSAQAMVAGLPVIASDNGGIPETVRSGIDGILVKPGDAEALAGAVLKLASDPLLRKAMGQAARESCLQRFGSENVTEKIVQFYEEILGAARS